MNRTKSGKCPQNSAPDYVFVLGPGITGDEDDRTYVGAANGSGSAILEIKPGEMNFFLDDDGDPFWQWGNSDFEPEFPDECGLESRTYGSLKLETQQLAEGECGGYLCAAKEISTGEYFRAYKGLKWTNVPCRNTTIAGLRSYTFERKGLVLNGGPSGRLELDNSAGERIATFTQDRMTGLGVASLSDFDAAKYRLYVEGKADPNNGDVRAVYAGGSVQIEREVTGPYSYNIHNIVAGTLQADIDRTKMFAVDARLNGSNKEVLTIWGNGSIISEGKIAGKEVVATLTPQAEVPDYVFAADYNLRPLSEVEAYVNEHRHLPGVPCAAEVKANGLDLAQMNLILLEKVEELTLYSIELEKRVQALEGEKSEE